MKILLVSDSHGHDEILKRIANKHNDCDYYLHLGDSQSLPERITPFVSVKGNCDFSHEFNKFITLDTPKGKLYAEHIPFYQMNLNELKKAGYSFYICGHTHIKKDEEVNGIRIINPGAVTYPRDNHASYAVLTIDEKSIDVKFYLID